MPTVSPAQKKLMEIAAHTKGGYGGVPQAVGREFVGKDADNSARAAGVMYKTDDGRVLYMMRAKDSTMGGKWSFPAGHIEDGESPEQAACREFQEETGFVLLELSLTRVGATDDGFVLFSAGGPEFKPTLNDEHSGYLWSSLGEEPYPLHPGIAKAFEDHAMDSARQTDDNGWVEIKDNPISKVGVFEYWGRSVSDKFAPDQKVRVFRPPEELASPKTIDSFKLIPWIDNHVMLGTPESGLTSPENKGVEGVIGEDVYFEDDTLYANIKVFSSNMDNLIDLGKRELSAGYRCRYEISSGVWNGQRYDAIQRDIRGNHLALVTEGRMGPDVAVLDEMQFTFDARDIIMADPKKDEETKKEMDEVKSALKSMQDCMKGMDDRLGAMDKRMKDSKEDDKDDPAIAADKKAKDEAEEKEKEEKKKGEDKKAVDAALKIALDAAIKPLIDELNALRSGSIKAAEDVQKAEIVSRLASHGFALDAADKPLADVLSAAVEKIGIKCEKGQEKAALDGFFTNRSTPGNEIGFALDHAKSEGSKICAVRDFFSKAA